VNRRVTSARGWARRVASSLWDDTPTTARTWLQGERGDQEVVGRLDRVARRLGGELLRDIECAGERIGQVAVLPTGVFVLSTLNWTGRATFKGDAVLYDGERHLLHAEIEDQRATVAACVGFEVPVDGLIVLVDRMRLRTTGAPAAGTTPVVWLDELSGHLDQRWPPPLGPGDIVGGAARLRGRSRTWTPTDLNGLGAIGELADTTASTEAPSVTQD